MISKEKVVLPTLPMLKNLYQTNKNIRKELNSILGGNFQVGGIFYPPLIYYNIERRLKNAKN